MIDKFQALKYTSGYASNEKKASAKFHFPLKNAELNKHSIRFVSKRDWVATKHSMLCELYFEEKYLRRCEKSTLQWLINPVPNVYPKNIPTIWSLPRKKSFPDELSAFQQRVGFQFKESDNCVLHFHLVFDDGSKLAKILESIRADYDLHTQLYYNGMALPLPQWFVQGHNAGKTEKSKLFRKLPSLSAK